MSLSSLLPEALGTVAFFATLTILILEIIIAHTLSTSSPSIRTSAAVASVFEGITLLVLIALLTNLIRKTSRYGTKSFNGVWFALCLLASVSGLVATLVSLIFMGKATSLPKTTVQAPTIQSLIGPSVALGFAFVGQLAFVVIYSILCRVPVSQQEMSAHPPEEGRLSPFTHVKSVPYAQTRSTPFQSRMLDSSPEHHRQSRPGSSSDTSATETLSSIRSSLSHMARPFGSRTRLLSSSSSRTRSGRRAPSLDSDGNCGGSNVAEGGFDSWDTSSVDSHNRQLVLDTSPPIRTRFLETIPASPTTSRSPSPGYPLDLEPPKRRERSRSYSSVPRAEQERTLSHQTSDGELHIHPLFRSDSPVPPPATTPGTVVVAAPNGGQTISERSLTRMRSGSLRSQPVPSPLSRQGSFASCSTDRLRLETPVEDRKMTPPLPEWILNAGSRTSLTEYHNRKLRDLDDSSSEIEAS